MPGRTRARFTASRAVAVIKPLISSRAANEVIFSNYVSRCQNVVMSGQKAGLCGWALFRASRRAARRARVRESRRDCRVGLLTRASRGAALSSSR